VEHVQKSSDATAAVDTIGMRLFTVLPVVSLNNQAFIDLINCSMV
jgi:hypothetical protein